MFGAPRVEPALGAQMAFGRVASGLGWVAFGALAVGVATRVDSVVGEYSENEYFELGVDGLPAK